ncbi:Trk-type K+ transport system, membrane component [Pilibacter termitis]|uniref:Trk-type K+ transport system, membrane component n=1 Tax=Pilibacter termitis TaxID=263852 RepID=A0A1T4N704_9ENTE|nr:TrkH family potassium uptake protein [Pilibacter termitis]SJZ74943.1 Trk-type K+ transport system, membrane component [Pilibacter termitis]
MRQHRSLQKIYQFIDKKIISRFSSIQIIVFYYLFLTLITFILFQLPFFRQPNSKVGLLDMIFMSVSTTSVTGLTTFDIHTVFNTAGIVLLEILFQVGGLGIMMISTFLFIFSKKKISLRRRQLIMIDMNQPRLSGVVRMIQRALIILIAAQFLFGIAFGIYFHAKGLYDNWGESFFWGIYESISAVTNSGFDVTGKSMIPFAHNYFFLYVVMFLIFLGGIGFPVLLEITDWIANWKDKQSRKKYNFSLFSKLALVTFLGLFIIGTILIFAFEKNHLYKNVSEIQAWTSSAFYSMTTRNAGLQINPMTDFQPNTLLIFSLLMFIGCSPSSVGGGIRTTTAIIVFLYVISFLKGEEKVNIFGRRIDDDDVRKSVVVMNLSLLFCFFATLILMATQEQKMIAIVFEVASAFGTTGLSLGITDDLTVIGKITIAILMFVGRVGTLYMLLLFVPKQTQDIGYLYPTEKIIIG